MSHRLALVSISLLAVLALASAASADLNQGVATTSPAQLLPGAVFAPDIPSPAEALGSALAARPYRPEEVVRYFEILAAASPRAELREYARTYEGRPLIILAVSDEATMGDLDSFRTSHAAALDPRNDLDPADMKAVAWMAYGIHGDELSSSDAACALAYWLVAGEDEQARTLRRELVVLIDPNENPDGRARYLAQTMSFAHRSANPDQDDLSHQAVWPWGRGNHYLFDLNRDWFSQVNPESARSFRIAAWLPQLMVDSHEMGANSTYLFPPPRHPFNPHLPASTRHWEKEFTDDQAVALDARGFPYFSGEWNEEFFPGYGSSWAAYHGSVGVLYEMSRTSGQIVRKQDGTLRTFAQAIEHQLTSSVANLTSLAGNRTAVLADMRDARRASIEVGRKGPVRAWIFTPDTRRPGRLAAFAALLEGQGIEVQALTAPVSAGGLNDARTGATAKLDLPVGTLMVRFDQPAGALAHALLDPHVPMESTFLSEEREYLEKGKGTRLYEVTAWSMPLNAGLPAYWSKALPGGSWSRWHPADSAMTIPSLADDWNSVVFSGDPDWAPPLLADLLQQGVTVRVAEKDFRAAGRSFHRGALVVRREGNPADLAAMLTAAALRHGADPVAVASFRAEDGPDLGGSHVPALIAPQVGVLSGMPVSPTAYGTVWHLLDQELDLRFSSLDVGRFRDVDLSRYNVLVFPTISGGGGAYRRLLGSAGLERLRAWIEGGGTAIGFRGGADLLADPRLGLTSSRFRSESLETYPSPVWSISALDAELSGSPSATGLRTGEAVAAAASPYDVAPVLGPGARPFAAGHDQGAPLTGAPVPMATWVQGIMPPGLSTPDTLALQQADARLRRFMPRGALLAVELHDESWLTHGLDDHATVMMRNEDALVSSPPATVAAKFAGLDDLHRGGLLWPEAAARLADTAYLTRDAVGRGQVILFASEPTFRRWMKESERMFVNAVLMGPGLGTRWSAEW